MITEKRCPDCGETKPLEAFAVSRHRKDGRTVYCRVCRSVQNKLKGPRRPEEIVPVDSKACFECKVVKPASAYGVDSKSKDGLQRRCKPCKNAETRNYRTQNENTVQVHRASRRRNYIASARVVWEYLSTHPCMDCGESDPIVLEFDHVRGEKLFNIAQRGQRTVKQVLAEIEKCEVRCSNCHKRKTAERGGWYQWLDEEVPDRKPPLWLQAVDRTPPAWLQDMADALEDDPAA